MIAVVISNQIYRFESDDELFALLEDNADTAEDTDMDDGIYYGDDD